MKSWVEHEFATVDMGDNRLNKRMKLVATRISEAPGGSLQSAFRGWDEVVGAYRFFNNERTTVESIITPHQKATLARVKEHERVVLIQDTSELDYTAKSKLKGTGPLSTKKRQGFFSHNHLVISPERLPLGIWNTNIYARDEREHGKNDQRKKKPIEKKESYRWLEGYRQACRLSESAPTTQVISCSDREGDIYEVFNEWHQRRLDDNPVADWLIRGNQDRSTVDEQNGRQQRIWEQVASSPLLGTAEIQVTKQIQYKKDKNGSRLKHVRPARLANLEIRTTTVTLDPPCRSGTKLAVVSFQVVMAKEKHPPPNDDPICWVLFTSLGVSGLEDSLEILKLYSGRWEIEVFHYVLKTGCTVEELQLKEDERIKPAIALYMVVAWRVMYAMKLGRECPNLPCDIIFEENEWKALWVIAYDYKALESKPSLGDFIMKVAEFGGFLGRKSDGPPGPKSIWQGMTRVRDFALAWKHFHEKPHLST